LPCNKGIIRNIMYSRSFMNRLNFVCFKVIKYLINFNLLFHYVFRYSKSLYWDWLCNMIWVARFLNVIYFLVSNSTLNLLILSDYTFVFNSCSDLLSILVVFFELGIGDKTFALSILKHYLQAIRSIYYFYIEFRSSKIYKVN
jgi:hypothetical protein